jgi:hypothetical protein
MAIVVGAIAVGANRPSPARSAVPPHESQRKAADALAKLPVSFVENRGQVDSGVRYYAQGNRYAFYAMPSEVLLSFADRQRTDDAGESPLQLALALRFVGSDPRVEPHGRSSHRA